MPNDNEICDWDHFNFDESGLMSQVRQNGCSVNSCVVVATGQRKVNIQKFEICI